MDLDDHAASFRFLLRDRDTKFVASFDNILTSMGLQVLRSPPRAPVANAFAAGTDTVQPVKPKTIASTTNA